MAHGGDLFALGDGVSSEPNFEIAFRGYDKTQVDKYLHVLEADAVVAHAYQLVKRRALVALRL